jgi:hypothetical protein
VAPVWLSAMALWRGNLSFVQHAPSGAIWEENRYPQEFPVESRRATGPSGAVETGRRGLRIVRVPSSVRWGSQPPLETGQARGMSMPTSNQVKVRARADDGGAGTNRASPDVSLFPLPAPPPIAR